MTNCINGCRMKWYSLAQTSNMKALPIITIWYLLKKCIIVVLIVTKVNTEKHNAIDIIP